MGFSITGSVLKIWVFKTGCIVPINSRMNKYAKSKSKLTVRQPKFRFRHVILVISLEQCSQAGKSDFE